VHLPANAWLLIGVASFAAGFINTIAGGGTLLSFPVLLNAGIPPIMANATNTLGLWPGSAMGTWTYRQRIAGHQQEAKLFAVPSLLGGLAGAVLLLTTPERAFRIIVPYLILLACALLLLNESVSRWMTRRLEQHPRKRLAALWLCQFAISIYGGYFGAGIGILMLAAMAIFLPEDMQSANALKNLFATFINAMAALYFIYAGAADLRVAGVMACCAVAGGYIGAHTAQRLSPRPLRYVVVAFGLGVAAHLLRQP
jgi:uncharacterized protein